MWPFSKFRAQSAELQKLRTALDLVTRYQSEIERRGQEVFEFAYKPEHASDLVRIQEDISSVFSSPYDLLAPFGQLFDGFKLLFPIFVTRLDRRLSSSYLFITSSQLDILRAYWRFTYESNPQLRGLIEGIKNYVLKDGFSYQITSETEGDESTVQDYIDSVLEANDWTEREAEIFRRDERDGETFLRFFPQEDGLTQIRVIEPEFVRPPHEDPTWAFGIKATASDPETPLKYFVTFTGQPADGEEVPADEIIHIKVNVDRNVRRGLSTIFSVQDLIQKHYKLLNAALMGESVRQSISYIRQYAQANAGAVQLLQQSSTDYLTAVPQASGIAKQVPTQIVLAGSVIDIPSGQEYQPGPVGAADNAKIISDLTLQALSVRYQAPIWMISGDTGDANYAASLSQESPFLRAIQSQQGFYRRQFKRVIHKLIEIGVNQGILPATASECDVKVFVPNAVAKNPLQETQRNKILHDDGILSDRGWSDLEGLDYDDEQDTMATDGDADKDKAKLEMQAAAAPSDTAGAQYKRDTEKAA